MSRVLLKADLLNEYVLQNDVVSIDIGELSVFKTWLWQLNSKAITLMDRGFACAATFHFMVAYNKPFVCCVSVGFNKQVQAFVASDSLDSETECHPVEFTINKTESIVNQRELRIILLIIKKLQAKCITILRFVIKKRFL